MQTLRQEQETDMKAQHQPRCSDARYAASGLRTRRGQSVMEFAILLPVIMIILAIVIEGALALNTWMRINTAARDATRFVLDAGRYPDAASLVVNKLEGINLAELNIFIIRGTTNDSGTINPSNWTVTHQYGPGPAVAKVTRAQVQQDLRSQGLTASRNVPFVVVEVDFIYRPIALGIFSQETIPMVSYALIQQY